LRRLQSSLVGIRRRGISHAAAADRPGRVAWRGPARFDPGRSINATERVPTRRHVRRSQPPIRSTASSMSAAEPA
jgi:hypothetical protein